MKRRHLFKALLGLVVAPAVIIPRQRQFAAVNFRPLNMIGLESLLRYGGARDIEIDEAGAYAATAAIPYIGSELAPARAAAAFAVFLETGKVPHIEANHVPGGFVYHLHFKDRV